MPPKRLFLSGIALLALALGGFLVWRQGRAPVTAEAAAAFLNRTLGAGRVGFTVARMETLRQDPDNLQVTVAAKARTLLPLYSAVDTADYLRRTFQLDPESVAEARRLLRTPGGSDLAGTGPLPTDPYLATIVQLRSLTDTPFDFQGVIDARRDGDTWTLSLVSGGFDGIGPDGAARSTFGAAAFEAGNARDEDRLRTLVAALQSFAARVAGNHRAIETARVAARDRRREAFLSLLTPGRVFSGAAGEQVGVALSLEIVGVSPDNRVSALLRNEGGWHYARALQGAWGADDAFENPTLTFVSTPDRAVRGAGPFLENTQTLDLTLRVDPQGVLSGHDRFYQYRFEPLDPEQASGLRARLEAELNQAVTATTPGALYQGAAQSRDSGRSEPVLVRMVSRSGTGDSIEAEIESVTRSWKRPLHGTIIANSRRSGRQPIRLWSSASEADEDAPADSVLGDPNDLDLHLGLDDGSLVGGDARYSCLAAPVGEADARQLVAGRAERVRHFLSVFRSGINYDGLLRDDQGSIIAARLEITGIDRRTGAIGACIHSMVQTNVHRDFRGNADLAGGSIVLTATDGGVYYPDGTISIPFLMGPSATALRLSLTGSSVSGRIEGDPHWAMTFPADNFLSAPTEDPEPNASRAAGSALPPLPTDTGAYLLGHGGWIPLPKSPCRVVEEEVEAGTDEGLAARLMAAVSEGLAVPFKKDKAKFRFLEFEGKDPRPKSGGRAIVLLYVGPALSGSPRVELAAEESLKEGKRRVEIMTGSTAGRRFGEQRTAAYTRPVGPDAVLLTTTSALSSGPYVFNADEEYELVHE